MVRCKLDIESHNCILHHIDAFKMCKNLLVDDPTKWGVSPSEHQDMNMSEIIKEVYGSENL